MFTQDKTMIHISLILLQCCLKGSKIFLFCPGLAGKGNARMAREVRQETKSLSRGLTKKLKKSRETKQRRASQRQLREHGYMSNTKPSYCRTVEFLQEIDHEDLITIVEVARISLERVSWQDHINLGHQLDLSNEELERIYKLINQDEGMLRSRGIKR